MRRFVFATVLASVGARVGVASGQDAGVAAQADAGVAAQADAGLAPAGPPLPSLVGPPPGPVPPGVANAQSRAALITQIQAAQLNLQGTPANHPHRPALVFQLGDDYVALADAALRDKAHAQALRQQLQALGQNMAAGQQKTLEDQAQAVMGAAHQKAIECYTLVANDHPTFAQIDLVLVRLAREHEAANDRTRARQVYYDLIKRRPGSPYVPRAYLAFGELFFDEALADPSKWALAEQAYAEVTKYPPPGNTDYGYAWYKLAFVQWHKGDMTKARNAFKKASDVATAYPQIPGAPALATAARTDAATLSP